jgi:hypothetical protein
MVTIHRVSSILVPWKMQDDAEMRMTCQLTACRIIEATADCTVAKQRR